MCPARPTSEHRSEVAQSLVFAETLRLFAFLPQQSRFFPALINAQRRAHLNRLQNAGDGERKTREQDRVPVVRQENPGGQEKSVLVAPLANHPRQMLEFPFIQPPSPRQKAARDEEEPV